MLMNFTVERSLLKMKCAAFTVRSQGYNKKFHYTVVFENISNFLRSEPWIVYLF